MEVKNLANTNLKSIVDCLTKSFENYFVPMPSEVEFWNARFSAARVDYSLSFGVFDEEKLVGFIIHGIDSHHKEWTAFNTGTGILKEYRGQKLVDKMYAYALPILKENGVTKCVLEVIEQNHKAVLVYERIGFKKDRFLRCFHGEASEFKSSTKAEQIDILSIQKSIKRYQTFYSWDHTLKTIIAGGESFKTFNVKSEDDQLVGYFVINKNNNSLTQLESFEEKYWMDVIACVKQIIPSIKINNVDENREACINALLGAGLQNHINQFEMTMYI